MLREEITHRKHLLLTCKPFFFFFCKFPLKPKEERLLVEAYAVLFSKLRCFLVLICFQFFLFSQVTVTQGAEKKKKEENMMYFH